MKIRDGTSSRRAECEGSADEINVASLCNPHHATVRAVLLKVTPITMWTPVVTRGEVEFPFHQNLKLCNGASEPISLLQEICCRMFEYVQRDP